MPQPECPNTHTNSPAWISKSIFSKTVTSGLPRAPGYTFDNPSTFRKLGFMLRLPVCDQTAEAREGQIQRHPDQTDEENGAQDV